METQASNPYQAPQAPVADSTAGAGVKMTPKEVFLSFEGRIPRKVFWLYHLAMYVPIIIIMGIAGAISQTLMWIVAVPLYIILIWAGLALQVKRWHDRDKSGWWCLIAFVPFIGGLWVLVEAGCMRGTAGGNRFGGDPTGLYDDKLF
ncbi:MAG TPA: DUF805 domain-containing protein [Burkholderiales bacterium]|jgi:uncharacterized membrane protein YhaH (DUF805 family)|nr:DUF805 domain-containing protein [Burkholderiales bacterium]